MNVPAPQVWFRLLLLCVLAPACGKKIGDACQTSVDCSLYGSRFCDISQPGGYCTVDGCDEHSCPSEAICVRFFPATFLTRACDPATEDVGIVARRADAGTGDSDAGDSDAGGSDAGDSDAGDSDAGDSDAGTDSDAGGDDAPIDTDAPVAVAAMVAVDTATGAAGTDDCLPDELCLPSGMCAARASERRYCELSCSDNSDCRGGYECRLLGTRGSVALTPSQQGRARFCAPHTD